MSPTWAPFLMGFHRLEIEDFGLSEKRHRILRVTKNGLFVCLTQNGTNSHQGFCVGVFWEEGCNKKMKIRKTVTSIKFMHLI